MHDVGVVPDAFYRDFFGTNGKASEGVTVNRFI
jgi:hypothetical protein